jgi:hypothetical protein
MVSMNYRCKENLSLLVANPFSTSKNMCIIVSKKETFHNLTKERERERERERYKVQKINDPTMSGVINKYTLSAR